MKIVSSAVCETGRVRKINQDAIYSFYSDEWGLFAVADGMGGHEKGERASGEIIDRIRSWIKRTPRPAHMETPEIVRQLKMVLEEANSRIIKETSPGMLCGCTIVIMVLVRQECILVTAGDSRCYRFIEEENRESFEQLTTDDVVGGSGPQKGRLTNALGIKSPMICRKRVLPFQALQRFLICTDGVYKYCTEAQILDTLRRVKEDNGDDAMKGLCAQVEENGAGDNYSAFLIWADNRATEGEK